MRILAASSVAATVLTLLACGVAAADPVPTATPSTSATSSTAPDPAAQAQQAANSAAARVSGLDSAVAQATRIVNAATVSVARADAALTVQLQAQADAAQRARTASAGLSRARQVYARDHAALVAMIVADYETSGGVSGAAQLLVADDPDQFLVSREMTGLVANYRSDALVREQAAERALRRARDSVAAALAEQQTATNRISALQKAAHQALATATAGLTSLRIQLSAAKTDQSEIDSVLSNFLGGWSLADPARAGELNQRYLSLAHSDPGHPAAAAGGPWTAAQGLSAVYRALAWIGTPYAWAGGNASGPTVGVCAGGGAQNDCHVTGFDCSGLALYAWAPYETLPHLAADQYTVAGHLHPDIAHLLPGDLVFWSSDGTVAGIHHVAIYLGDGNVLQAPQSGDIVRVTPIGAVDSGYFGATRPRT